MGFVKKEIKIIETEFFYPCGKKSKITAISEEDFIEMILCYKLQYNPREDAYFFNIIFNVGINVSSRDEIEISKDAYIELYDNFCNKEDYAPTIFYLDYDNECKYAVKKDYFEKVMKIIESNKLL